MPTFFAPKSSHFLTYARRRDTMLETEMQRIIAANIDRFARLLETELDSERRLMIAQLLQEEKDKAESLSNVTCAKPKKPRGKARP
jgi:hypothetical protein